MSRIYFHSPSGTAELSGAERAWLDHLTSGPSEVAWELDTSSGFERASEILAMVPEVPEGESGANYLHRYLREAQTQEIRNKSIYHDWRPGNPLPPGTDHKPARRLVSALKTAMRVDGVEMHVFGVQLHSRNVDLNTALVAGSDPVALAAKIHGWCESHAWVEGAGRAWLADIIDHGLDTGLYRRDMGWERPRLCDDGPGVVPLLRSRSDEPVVMSYSVCDDFPNASTGDWMPPWPEGVSKDWDALSAEQQQAREGRGEAWYELSSERQWEISMAGLRDDLPWARLSPETLREVTFGHPVTVYDLISADRDGRLRATLGTADGAQVFEPKTDIRGRTG